VEVPQVRQTPEVARGATSALPDGMRRSLGTLRAAGVPVPLAELARRLLALQGTVPARLARRLAAELLGAAPDALPEVLPPGQLRPAEESAVAAEPLERAAFAVVDLETTGLSSERDAIIEIGAVRVCGMAAVARFETLVRPPGPGPLSGAIAALTGIDDAMLADAPPLHRALADFATWLGPVVSGPPAPWVAHNAAFDSRFLRRAFEGQTGSTPAVAVLCTRKLGRRLLPGLGRYDLDHLCAHFRIPNRARHRALGDAEATARAWIELLGIARAEGHATVGDLLDLQERPTRRRRRRGSRRRGAR